MSINGDDNASAINTRDGADLLEESEYIDATPSREVVFRMNNKDKPIGDCFQENKADNREEGMREILNEIKSLRSQVNNLQSQVHEQQPKNVSSDNYNYFATYENTTRPNDERPRDFASNHVSTVRHSHSAPLMNNLHYEQWIGDHSNDTSLPYARLSQRTDSHRAESFDNSRSYQFPPGPQNAHNYVTLGDMNARSYSNFGHSRSHQNKGRKPATFDGSINWQDYIVHFNLIAELNQWNDETKALELATNLRGPALSVLSDLRPDFRHDFRHLVSTLAARFDPENQTEIYKTQLKSRIRKKNETITELVQDVKRLVRMAYPTAPLSFRDQITKDSFIESLNDHELEWSVFQGRPKTVEDAVQLALEYEAFQQARGRRNRLPVRMQREEPMSRDVREVPHQVAAIHQKIDEKPYKKRGPCYYCKKDGHLKRDCRILQRDLEREKRRNAEPQRSTTETESTSTSNQGNGSQLM